MKINPIGILFGQYGLDADILLQEGQSLGIGAKFYTYEYESTSTGIGSDTVDISGRFNGAVANASYRFYTNSLKASNFEGFFAAPYGKFTTRTMNGVYQENGESKGAATLNNLAVGGLIGTKKVWRTGFLFEFNVGAGYKILNTTAYDSAKTEEEVGQEFDTLAGIIPIDFRLALSIGYRF